MLEDLPDNIAVGTKLNGEEEYIVYVVESIDEKHAILNTNHELAGIALVATSLRLISLELIYCFYELVYDKFTKKQKKMIS